MPQKSNCESVMKLKTPPALKLWSDLHDDFFAPLDRVPHVNFVVVAAAAVPNVKPPLTH